MKPKRKPTMTPHWFASLLLLASAAAGCGERTAIEHGAFVDVAERVGIRHPTVSGSPEKRHIRETLGNGVCWTDSDRDGDLDLLVVNGGTRMLLDYSGREELLKPWRFYRNRGDGFDEVASEVGLDVLAWGIGCAAGDVDGDGFDDLFITTAAGPNRFFHNRGDGTFENWTKRSGLGSRALCTGAALGDLDNDGDLDLVVARYLDESRPPPGGPCDWKGAPVLCGPKGFPSLSALLYLNDGSGVFTETDALAGHSGFGLGVVLFDADRDGDGDIFVANDSSPNHFFLNEGDARFREVGLVAGVAFSDSGSTQAGMGVDAADLDGDGLQDLVVTNFSDDVHNFYRNDGDLRFSEWSGRSGLAAASFTKLGWAVICEDFDLDGDVDVFLVNGHVFPQVDQHDPNTSYRQPMQLLFNDGSGRFSAAAERVGGAFDLKIAGRSAAPADFDGDGDVDLLVTRDGEPPLLLRNDLPAVGSHWLKVRLIGRRTNREGIGARIELYSAGRRQVREIRRNRGYLSGGVAEVVFGLGAATHVERLIVSWPASGQQIIETASVDQVLLVEEPSSTSSTRGGADDSSTRCACRSRKAVPLSV